MPDSPRQPDQDRRRQPTTDEQQQETPPAEEWGQRTQSGKVVESGGKERGDAPQE